MQYKEYFDDFFNKLIDALENYKSLENLSEEEKTRLLKEALIIAKIAENELANLKNKLDELEDW